MDGRVSLSTSHSFLLASSSRLKPHSRNPLFKALLLASSLGWSLAAPPPSPGSYEDDDTWTYGKPGVSPAATTFASYYSAGNSTSSGCWTGMPAPVMQTMKTQSSLLKPTRSSGPWIPKMPQTMKSDQSLDGPASYIPVTAHVENPNTILSEPANNSPTRSTPKVETTVAPTYFSPRTHVSETSLDVPSNTAPPIAYTPVTGHPEPSLNVPNNPTPTPTKQSQILPDEAPQPGAVLVSIVSLINSVTKDSHYVFEGQTIAPGSTGVVVEGTTYSVAPTGGAVVYVNGVETAASAIPGLDRDNGGSVSGIGGYGEDGEITSGISASTAVSIASGESPSTSTFTPAQQTTSGGSRAVRISSAGLGLAMLVCMIL
ncbi:uncharacterized protein MYCFIDRAFT_192220 [Pseudocercospora fijiensis CIRAD86]|uniref:Uncharacterized protein n=1 Tax=Pseudocercospora fijiensis (strain CIRAD86) TaxID=383855 RepID=N1QAG8_PSEFD|nr:uncharacterized protein MYCFIDRAFT_192220 [Pseudocercospora fijiensis CIRAD86]EME87928.1 hypothetical protein MYCFIDRAFT_192220 [Pseudocercospora fijiensis CIRAD86]